jgi:hypothetical protein
MLHTDPPTLRFIAEHRADDPAKLLLSARKYPEVDIPFVAEQLQARRQIREKLPEWYASDLVVLPSRIAAEQCSSWQTAAYKQRLVVGTTLCDLTGGLGVDSYYLSKQTERSIYIERFADYCEAARHNFGVLGAKHIEVVNGDSRSMELPEVDTIYLDPARRGDAGKRLFDLHDCEPDVVAMKGELLAKAKRVVVKVSPMADVSRTLALLPETVEVHVLSVKGECKELLFVMDREAASTVAVDKCNAVTVTCVNYLTDGREVSFGYRLADEAASQPLAASAPMRYLYEPNASILKAGAFRTVAHRFALRKLHPNSHLYTSDELAADFPGRIFEVGEVIDFASKNIKTLASRYPKANLTTRNFPLTVDALRKKTKIKDGGDDYLFATTCEGDRRVVVCCRKV